MTKFSISHENFQRAISLPHHWWHGKEKKEQKSEYPKQKIKLDIMMMRTLIASILHNVCYFSRWIITHTAHSTRTQKFWCGLFNPAWTQSLLCRRKNNEPMNEWSEVVLQQSEGPTSVCTVQSTFIMLLLCVTASAHQPSFIRFFNSSLSLPHCSLWGCCFWSSVVT